MFSARRLHDLDIWEMQDAVLHPCGTLPVFYKKYFMDVSRELDEFRVNTYLCKLRCLYLLRIIYYMKNSPI